MPIKIIRQDITKIKCDAIVNPTNRHLYPGGGIDKAIHKAAGSELEKACDKIPLLDIGQAVITPAFELPCKYVIHTAGPKWLCGNNNEEELLKSCYRESLKIAKENRCKTVAFPLISSGILRYPKDQVLKVAMDTISEFLMDNDMLVYIVVFDKTAYKLSEKLFADITAFIDDNYVEENSEVADKLREKVNYYKNYSRIGEKPESKEEKKPNSNLEAMLSNMDKGFAQTLFNYIDKKGLTDVECYKAANIDKKVFSKIRCNADYKPSKITVVSFAIALRLNLEETLHLLSTVGMTLSQSDKFDVIIEYFVKTGNYKNIFDVNEVLYQFEQKTLGV